MGYRWNCLTCGYWDCHQDELKRKMKHDYINKGHKMYGGAKVWKHPEGEHTHKQYIHGLPLCFTCKDYWDNKYWDQYYDV